MSNRPNVDKPNADAAGLPPNNFHEAGVTPNNDFVGRVKLLQDLGRQTTGE